MPSHQLKIGALILAAGNSIRLNGLQKQLLIYRGETLLRRAVKAVLQPDLQNVVVVINSENDLLKIEIEDLPVVPLINQNTQIGVSSSIKLGIEMFSRNGFDAVLITLCDQPLISAKVLRNLVNLYIQTRKPIIASEYKNTVGVPAIFGREIFGDLLELSGDQGAKKIIEKYQEKSAFVHLPEASFDIDTLADYEKLVHSDRFSNI